MTNCSAYYCVRCPAMSRWAGPASAARWPARRPGTVTRPRRGWASARCRAWGSALALTGRGQVVQGAGGAEGGVHGQQPRLFLIPDYRVDVLDQRGERLPVRAAALVSHRITAVRPDGERVPGARVER